MLSSIVYVSEALQPFDDRQLMLLEHDSSGRNRERGVTGYLWFDRDRFLQYIEGECGEVDELFGSICRDPRHRVLGSASESPCVTRRFPAWSMRRLRPVDVIEIRLEQLLSEHLMLTRQVNLPDPAWEQVAWRIVAAISSLHGKC